MSIKVCQAAGLGDTSLGKVSFWSEIAPWSVSRPRNISDWMWNVLQGRDGSQVCQHHLDPVCSETHNASEHCQNMSCTFHWSKFGALGIPGPAASFHLTLIFVKRDAAGDVHGQVAIRSAHPAPTSFFQFGDPSFSQLRGLLQPMSNRTTLHWALDSQSTVNMCPFGVNGGGPLFQGFLVSSYAYSIAMYLQRRRFRDSVPDPDLRGTSAYLISSPKHPQSPDFQQSLFPQLLSLD